MDFQTHLTKRTGPRGSGDEPRSIRHYYLTDTEKAALKAKLKPFVDGVETDRSKLRAIFKDKSLFPSRIMNDLEALVDEKKVRAAYVVHNLPELTDAEIPKEEPAGMTWKRWVIERSYTSFTAEGIYSVLGVTGSHSPLVRHSGDKAVPGRYLHRDNKMMASLGGVRTDGAMTRYTDFEAVVKQAAADPELAGFTLQVRGNDITLGELARTHASWDDMPEGFTVIPAPDQPEALVRRYQHIVDQCSLSQQVGPGDLVFWRNTGGIFHQAMPTQREEAIDQRSATEPARLAVAFTSHRGDDKAPFSR